MITVWGRRSSSNVQKVLWVCAEAGQIVTHHDAGGRFGGLDTPEFLARNPNGKVPVIDDDGYVLWESNAIVRYVATCYAPDRFWPADPKQQGRISQWMDWQHTTLAPVLFPLYGSLVRTPAEKRNAETIDDQMASVAAVLQIPEAALSDRPYLLGDHFSLADIPLAVWLHRWFTMMDRPQPAMPNLLSLYERLKQRPPYQSIVVGVAYE